MHKLPKQHQFFDLSDYGRSIAKWIALKLKNTSFTAIDVTTWFIISGILAIICMIYSYPIAAAFFLILKSILDAADGELAHLKEKPSYVGRYYDSIADFILNFLFLLTFWYITDSPLYQMILAFIGIQLQGTLYNYYHVILRHNVGGKTISRVFEYDTPTALKGESQRNVNISHKVFITLYFAFDTMINYMDRGATKCKPFPQWFMTMVSSFGLGSQLMIMAIFLVLDLQHLVIPFFIFYSLFIFIYIGIRRLVLN